MTDRDLKRANLTISPKILVENKLSVALLLCFPYPRISKSKDLNSREKKNRQAVQMGTEARAFTSASSFVGECMRPWRGNGSCHISRALDTQQNFLL